MGAVIQTTAGVSRRSLLKTGGALVVSVGMPIGLNTVLAIQSAKAQTLGLTVPHKPPMSPNQLSSYIAVNADGMVSAYFGKVDVGQGLVTAIGQIVAEELDVPFRDVQVFIGDTATTLNQGDASGSTGIEDAGKQMRFAAAEARRVLLAIAAEKFGVSPAGLTVVDGVVSGGTHRLSYARLVAGQYFNVELAWNHKIGNALFAPGQAKPKDPTSYKIVGQPLRRADIPPKVFAQQDFVTDIRVPGMVHARVVRPAVVGAVPINVDEASISDISGARVVWEGAFLGVVAEKEWDAIKAAQKLRVEWSEAKPAFPDPEALYDHIRNAPARKREVQGDTSLDMEAAFKAAARVIEAEYEWPFQSHASMGPACALVDIKSGKVTCWTGSQKFHYARDGVAATLGVSPENVQAIWMPGPGSYGRNDAGDAVIDAAVFARAVGRPVRLQYMRAHGTGWDPKAPASIHRVRAAVGHDGNVVAYEFASKGFSRMDIATNESDPGDSLAGQLRGLPRKSVDAFGVPGDSYVFPRRSSSWETIAPLLELVSPLRTAHMRDPVGPQIHFASESFIDEIAYALNMDPVEFRLRHLREPRDVAVIRAAAEKSGWQPRSSPRRGQTGATVTGRGLAYIRSGETRVAIITEVEVDRSRGRVRVRKVTVAHDCGLIINPEGLRHVIESNVIQGVSRAIFEEVHFNSGNVTSVDWASYPILDIADAPETIDIVLLNHPELPAAGAGEAATRPVAAAIANAVFDATGVRIHRAPLSPQRLKAQLSL